MALSQASKSVSQGFPWEIAKNNNKRLTGMNTYISPGLKNYIIRRSGDGCELSILVLNNIVNDSKYRGDDSCLTTTW